MKHLKQYKLFESSVGEDLKILSEILQDVFDDFDITYWDKKGYLGENRVWTYEPSWNGITIHNASPIKKNQSWSNPEVMSISNAIESLKGRIKASIGKNIDIKLVNGKLGVVTGWAIDINIQII